MYELTNVNCSTPQAFVSSTNHVKIIFRAQILVRPRSLKASTALSLVAVLNRATGADLQNRM